MGAWVRRWWVVERLTAACRRLGEMSEHDMSTRMQMNQSRHRQEGQVQCPFSVETATCVLRILCTLSKYNSNFLCSTRGSVGTCPRSFGLLR